MVNLAALVWRRLLRKRWVLALVFGLSLVYFLTSTLKQRTGLLPYSWAYLWDDTIEYDQMWPALSS